MSRARLVSLLAVAAVAAGAATATAQAGTTECKGIKNCIDVIGPWVVVPAHGNATFLLSCPKQGGVIGGVDAQATSSAVHVTFDGLLGGPVGAGLTTSHSAYFRGLTVSGTGAFQPRIGCTPASSGGRQTTSARAASPGGALTLMARTLNLTPGSMQTATVSCPRGSQFVSSWDATAFRTSSPPDLGLAGAIRVKRSDAKSSSSVTVTTSETLPSGAHAQVQLGVVCAG